MMLIFEFDVIQVFVNFSAFRGFTLSGWFLAVWWVCFVLILFDWFGICWVW